LEAAYIIGTVIVIAFAAGIVALQFAQAIAIEKKKEAEMKDWKNRVDKLNDAQKENIASNIDEYLYRRH
jgi:hypothetical protein